MALLLIDNVAMPDPSEMKINRMDLDSPDSSRNEMGVLQRDRIRQGVYKIELRWRALTSSQLETVENAIEPVSVNVTFPTPGGNVTKKMYAGDRSIETVSTPNGFRWDLAFNLIEY